MCRRYGPRQSEINRAQQRHQFTMYYWYWNEPNIFAWQQHFIQFPARAIYTEESICAPNAGFKFQIFCFVSKQRAIKAKFAIFWLRKNLEREGQCLSQFYEFTLGPNLWWDAVWPSGDYRVRVKKLISKTQGLPTFLSSHIRGGEIVSVSNWEGNVSYWKHGHSQQF